MMDLAFCAEAYLYIEQNGMCEVKQSHDALVSLLGYVAANKDMFSDCIDAYSREDAFGVTRTVLRRMVWEESAQAIWLDHFVSDIIGARYTHNGAVAASVFRLSITSLSQMAAIGLLYDSSYTVFMAALLRTSSTDLTQFIWRLLQRESGHFRFFSEWALRLAKEGGDSVKELRAALLANWAGAFAWYGPPDDVLMEELRTAGYMDATPDILRQTLAAHIAPVISAMRLRLPLIQRRGNVWENDAPLDWRCWIPETRSLAAE